MKPEQVETTTTNDVAPTLKQANQKLRYAVQKREAEKAIVNVPPAAHAASEVSPQDYYPPIRPGSQDFINVLRRVEELHLRKTLDYGSDDDALENIRRGAEAINAEPLAGAVIRMADKMQRLKSHFVNGRLEFENVSDTLLDLCSYSALALVLWEESRNV